MSTRQHPPPDGIMLFGTKSRSSQQPIYDCPFSYHNMYYMIYYNILFIVIKALTLQGMSASLFI